MERRIREEYVDEAVPVGAVPGERRRVVTEERVGGYGMNPLGMVIAAALVVFILVLIFGFLI